VFDNLPMKKHTKVYLNWIRENYDLEPHEAVCEITGTNKSLDVCHIVPRGIGGNPSGNLDDINNLMCMTRVLHYYSEGNLELMPILKDIHGVFMNTGLPLYQTQPEKLREPLIFNLVQRLI
jgi:hypothetical protein